MIQIQIPDTYTEERCYVLSIIFGSFLGVEFSIEVGNYNAVYINLDGGKQLKVADVFFKSSEQNWLTTSSLPTQPLEVWDTSGLGFSETLVHRKVPVLYGLDKNYLECSEDGCFIELNLDVLGSAFFLLSGYEELVNSQRDRHERFLAEYSLALQEDFLTRPILDEYIEILWFCLTRLSPNICRTKQTGKIRITCDVDHPYDRWAYSFSSMIKGVGGALVKHGSPKLALRRFGNGIFSKYNNYQLDPNYTFDWYMDKCEQYGHKATFFFIAGHSAGAIDGFYDLQEPRICELIDTIFARGHEIGMHGSYNTLRDERQMQKERANLMSVCYKISSKINVLSNRQHYLRWDVTKTPDLLDSVGLSYDSTGTFADYPGFKYGTSKPFRMWSWIKNKPLRLKQRPLVLMESSVISNKYLGLGYTSLAKELMLTLKRRALLYGGDFVILWHNSHLRSSKDKVLLEEMLS